MKLNLLMHSTERAMNEDISENQHENDVFDSRQSAIIFKASIRKLRVLRRNYIRVLRSLPFPNNNFDGQSTRHKQFRVSERASNL
jgi:hypothetical protein